MTNPDYELNKDDVVRVYNSKNALQKRRTLLNKDLFKVKGVKGNIFELENTNTKQKLYKPRFEIKSLF